MTGTSLPFERAWPFLAVRRGLPLLLALCATLAAFLEHSGRGWFLLLAVACVAEVGPAFFKGERYLSHRRAIVRRDGMWARALQPLARLLGLEEPWILAFCAWNNRRVSEVFEPRRAKHALVLLPHCIQMARCKVDILDDLNTCHQCGLCCVGDGLKSALEGRWDVRISNRSHKAYREAREFRPDLIVAVSCATRLLKGLVRLPEVPCYVIALRLPHGMCVDTEFNVSQLKAAMDVLVEPKAERYESSNIAPLHANPA